MNFESIDNKKEIYISVIVPVFNEEGAILNLYKKILNVCKKIAKPFEIIFVNDGSTDKTFEILKTLKPIKIINFRKNFGQTSALDAGIKVAQGRYIVTLDGDGQNDPVDIPRLLGKLKQDNLDAVSGWRKDRKDKLFSRKIPSLIANWLISKITKVKLHDFGCTLKLYKQEVIKDVKLYGEMHRFIPAYTAWYGAKIGEISVNHLARMHGKTKYGISRTFRVLLDLITVKFLTNYFARPMHFFGKVGFVE